jgi:hypothetical protein
MLGRQTVAGVADRRRQRTYEITQSTLATVEGTNASGMSRIDA